MMWIGLIFIVFSCLMTLFKPRVWLLFGERWRLKDGGQAEPSEEYIFMSRVGAVIVLLIILGFGIWILVVEQERKTAEIAEEEARVVGEAWGSGSAPALDSVPVSDETEVQGKEYPLSEVMGEEKYDPDERPTRYAVVGSDDADPHLKIPDAVDGDLVIKVADTLDCHVSRLVVQEDSDAVRIAVMYMWTSDAEATRPAWIAADDSEVCEGEPFFTLLQEESVTHVPLDEPLGEREVLDLESGNPIPSVVAVAGPVREGT